LKATERDGAGDVASAALAPRLPVIPGRGEIAGALSAGAWISSRDGRHVIFDREHAAKLLSSPNVGSPGVDLSRGVPADMLAELLEVVPVMRARKSAMRNALGQSLLPRVVERRRAAFRAGFVELLSGIEGREELDFAQTLSIPYGVRIGALTLGLPQRSEREVGAIFSPAGSDPALPFRVETAVADERLNAMVEAWLASEAGLRCKDSKAALAVAARDTLLSQEELHDAVVDMLVASIHGVAAGLNAGAILLASEPAQWESLQHEPELVNAAVEETLRVAVGRPFINRLVLADFEYGDVRFERGDVICVFLAATNAVVKAAEPARAFDIRADRCPHLSFGRGPSFCAGSAMVRIALVEALTELATRLVRLEQTGAAERKLYAGREYIDSIPMRLSWR
jgi:cytochrome P450